MHVLIVGLGGIGRLLAINLVAQGHQVTGMSRTPQVMDGDLSGVRHLAQSVHEAHFEQLPPIDWIYVLLTPDARDAQSYQHIFVDSLKPLHAALKNHPVQRVVFISSTSVFGSGRGEWMDENTPPQPDTATANVLWQAEQQWRQLWADKLVVVRPSGIYGAGRLRLLDWVRTAKPVKLNQWTNRIHSDDLAGFLTSLTTLNDVFILEKLYIATDHEPALQQDVLDYIASSLHLPKVEKLPALTSGKRLRSIYQPNGNYVFQYESYRQGYKKLMV